MTTTTSPVRAAQGSPLAASLYAAAGLAWRLSWNHAVTPSHIAVDIDDDGDHWITCEFDQSTARTPGDVARIASAARRLDLPETTGAARSFREWSGEHDGRYVNLVLYLPGDGPSRLGLFVANHQPLVIPAIAAAGAAAALAVRRALTR